MTYTLIDEETPWPLLRAAAAHTPSTSDSAIAAIVNPMRGGKSLPLFRGVPIDRYPRIAATGVDTAPTDSGIFCDFDLSKAFEYTGTPNGPRAGAIMVYHGGQLERSWRTLPEDADADTITDTLRDYPYQDTWGDKLWFSRLPDTNPHNGYELSYGYWIPGDPHAALAAVILVGAVDRPYDWSPPDAPAQIWEPPSHWLPTAPEPTP